MPGARNQLIEHVLTATLAAGAIAALAVANPNTPIGVAFAAVALGVAYVWFRMRKHMRRRAAGDVPPPDIAEAIERNVLYYQRLSPEDQERFLRQVHHFLLDARIAGVGMPIDSDIRACVAASAVIVTFGFRDYDWEHLRDIVVYPEAFDEDYRVHGEGERSGEVGDQGPIVFSSVDLVEEFRIGDSGHNVGLHEFAHVLDGLTGYLDGMPPYADAETAEAWSLIVREEVDRGPRWTDPDMRELFDDYAHSDETEFFAAMTEAFFELPDVLYDAAPTIYELLTKLYRQDPLSMLEAEADAMPAAPIPAAR